jgi:hypothetical protein
MRKGIAISVYDKFEELAMLVDIIRQNFSDKYLIAVCCNHPHGERYISKQDIDGYVQGRDIYFSPELSWSQARALLVCRSTDTVQRSCNKVIELGADVVMHIHCDAWPLNESKLNEHFALISEQSKKFVARGYGFGFYGRDVPLGRIDDHFFFFDAPYLREVNFFKFDPLEMLPHKLSIHGILSVQILAKVGMKNFLLYHDQSCCECWPGQEKYLPWYPVKPSSYDPVRHFLHVHRQSYPEDWGQRLQALYLRQNGITIGNTIKVFLEQYTRPDEDIIKMLNSEYRYLTHSLRKWGLQPEPFAQDIVAMREALVHARKSWPATQLRRLATHALFTLGLQRVPKRKVIGDPDSLWPEVDVADFYREMIDKSWFPPHTEFWFDSQ